MTAMPMFPLGSVLFPHTPLPLRIFEPRYLKMVGQLLDEHDPTFGVVLIWRGHEAGGGDQRTDVGTLARLVSLIPGADDIQVVAWGTERFTVDRWLDDDPYPRAELTPLPPLEWHDALEPLRVEAEAIVRRALARDPDAVWSADTELSDDPVEAAWQLAAIAPLGAYDRHTLLQSTTVAGLLREIIDLTLELELLLPDE